MGHPQTNGAGYFNVFEKLRERDYQNQILDRAPAIPEAVKRWLGRVSLLYGVPFSYLVADEKLLAPESLRFFYFDPNWLACLLDGALSLGRSADARLLLGKAMAGNFLAEVIQEAKTIRPQLQGKTIEPTPAQGTWQLTGFLLRSTVVAGWRGLEIQAYADTEEPDPGEQASRQPLPLLRLERLANDVLFGLVEGLLKQLVITQPAEHLHFAVSEAVPLRQAPEAPHVVQIKEQVAQMCQKLGKADIGAAEFARHMVAQPIRYRINLHEASPPQ
jgi:hypothetical protein